MKRSNRMLRLIYFILLALIILCIVNVLVVSIFAYHFRSGINFDSYVKNVSLKHEDIYAKRGNIYDANGEIVAQDEKRYDIICYLDPSRKTGNEIQYIDDPLYTSKALASILDMEQSDIFYYLTNNPNLYQTELGMKGRGLSEEIKNEILDYPNIHGIGFKETNRRLYNQNDDFAPYLIGFAQRNDEGKLVGKMGLELYLNEELSGIDGVHTYQQDKHGYILNGMYEKIEEASNGYDVYTTLDTSVQEALQQAISDVFEFNNASKAWGSVVEVDTGKILAWSQSPSFDPNILEIDDYNNFGSQVPYEPGSVMKAFIYATAMDMGTYRGDNTFDSSKFCYYSNGRYPYRTYGDVNYGCITNAEDHSWGTIPLDYGLIYSSNVATSTLLCDYVGVEAFESYLDKFGFFKEVDSDGIAESVGVKNFTWPSDELALSYGQGSSVTMLQLVQAYTAIFGNGEMVKPYFIDKVVDSDNNRVIYQGQRKVVNTPIKESTAKQIQELLGRVVSDKSGTAKFYAVDEVDIIAKTGTSELVVNGGYNSDDSLTSVMLAFPREDPKYMIYFAYESPYDYYNHTHSDPVKNLIKRVAILTDIGYNPNENQIQNTITKYNMPNVLNDNYELADDKLSKMNLVVIKIGSGDTVLKQSPEANDNVYTKQKVYLYTNDDSIIMPNMSNWTRKEVIDYWNISGMPFVLDGYGVVKEQSIAPGSMIDKNSDIIIKFKPIDSNININPQEDIEDSDSELEE